MRELRPQIQWTCVARPRAKGGVVTIRRVKPAPKLWAIHGHTALTRSMETGCAGGRPDTQRPEHETAPGPRVSPSEKQARAGGDTRRVEHGRCRSESVPQPRDGVGGALRPQVGDVGEETHVPPRRERLGPDDLPQGGFVPDKNARALGAGHGRVDPRPVEEARPCDRDDDVPERTALGLVDGHRLCSGAIAGPRSAWGSYVIERANAGGWFRYPNAERGSSIELIHSFCRNSAERLPREGQAVSPRCAGGG